MEFKGTGGTWSVSGEKYFTIESKVQHERHTVPIVTIATINSSFRPTEESKANAKLISKSLAMLEKLNEARIQLAQLRRSMTAHPDCTEGSEFDDFTSSSQELEDEIEQLIKEVTE
jgi:hypothetical protein